MRCPKHFDLCHPLAVLVLVAALALSLGTQLGYWPSVLDVARRLGWHDYRGDGGGGGSVRVFTREELARYTGRWA